MKHIPALDGVRGLAIALVLMVHAGHLSGWATSYHQGLVKIPAWFVEAGWCGVDLFFVLSGFLITSILLESKGKPHYFRNFYIRRSLRIFPLYFAVVGFRLIVAPMIGWWANNPVDFWQAASYWTYTSNVWQSFFASEANRFDPVLGVSWSLAVEEQFYMLWPLVVYMLNRRQLTWLCAAAIPAAVASRIALYCCGAQVWAAYTLTPCRLDGFAVGAIVSILQAGKLLNAAKILLPLSAACVASLVIIQRSASDQRWPMALIGFTCFDLLFGSLLVFVLNGWFRSVFESSPLRTFGKYSYGMYLAHVPVFAFLNDQLVASDYARFMFLATAGTVVVVCMAMLSWSVYESPILSLKSRFENHRQRSPL